MKSPNPIYVLTVYTTVSRPKQYSHHTPKSARHHAKTLACSDKVVKIDFFDGTKTVEIYLRGAA